MIETILKYFDWSVTFLHASVQIALGIFIVCFTLLLLAKVIIDIYCQCRYYKSREKRIEFLESEVKRLKVNVFQMGFTDYAPIWLTVEESKKLNNLVQRIEDDICLTENEMNIWVRLKERIEQVEVKE